MATIVPFRALRYDTAKAGSPESLCCPPYDIIPPARQAEMEAESPYNVIRLERPLGEDCYRRAGETLKSWRDGGILKQDEAPAFYRYSIRFDDRGTQRTLSGFLARVKLAAFSENVVLPHEETLSKDKSDRFSLMEATFCNISPVYGLYRDDDGRVERLLTRGASTPAADFTMPDDTRHSLTPVTDPTLTKALSEAFSDKQIIIADGHHRYETALDFERARRAENPRLPYDDPCSYIMMMLVSFHHPGLVVWPTHRLVKGFPDFDAAMFTGKLLADFHVKRHAGLSYIEETLLETPHTVGLYAGGDGFWTIAPRDPAGALRRALPDKSEAYRGLEVSLLHSLLLEPYFGIDRENLAAQKNLTYTRSLDEALDSVRQGLSQAAFLLPPTRIADIAAVSAHGERMPQKSTYFYPKLITGLTINPLR